MVFLGLFKFWRVVYLVYWDLNAVQTVKINSLTSGRSVIENLEKELKLKVSGVFGFSFSAIEPIRKDGKDRVFRKVHFCGKVINELLFLWA